MTTKLDELVGYLAGREGSPKLKEELADPLSDASLFLEATRNRSRALIEEPQIGPLPKLSQSRPWLVGVIFVLTLIFSTVILAYLFETRIRHLEDSQRRSDAESRTRAEKLQLTLNRLTESRPIETDFERIHSDFEKLEKRLDGQERTLGLPRHDPSLVEIRESLTSVRKEVSALEKGSLRQAEDFRVTTLEIARLLRLLVSRSQPAGTENIPEFLNPRRP